jgi:hypothetical protein
LITLGIAIMRLKLLEKFNFAMNQHNINPILRVAQIQFRIFYKKKLCQTKRKQRA